MNENSSPTPPDAGDAELSDTDLESMSDRLCADLVDRWRRGERVPVEAYFRQHPQLKSGETFFELILTEVVLRQTNGEATPLDEYLWRFPQFEERLRRHFSLHEELLTGPTHSGLTAISGKAPLSPNLLVPVPEVPGYEILGELGRGGMGVVFKARDVRLGRRVAMKFLPIEFTSDRQRLERFLREARTASSLNHPHICTVHALGEYQDQPFIVMEYIDGNTLHKLLQQRPAVEETVRIFTQAAQALAAAHENGVVHRDIKPENIMVRDDRIVKVLDFGLARQLPTLAETNPPGPLDTDPGTLLGTVSFMSPEQAQGQVAESASDVFSLGIVLYLLLTGQHPFAGETAIGTLHAIVNDPVISPVRLNLEVPRPLATLVEGMLHKEAQLRPTAQQVSTSLEMLGRHRGPRSIKAGQQHLIARYGELGTLRRGLESADAGRGTMLCVVGEPGIGKSTLVETLLDELADAGRDCFVARGRCSERLVGTDAYLPVIDALEDLLRTETGETAARLMKVVAPTWYSRIALTASAPAPDASEAPRASSQQSMLREFGNLLEEASRLGLVVLYLDDVHWADISTVALLAHLGRICCELRLLVIVTYRPTEMLLGPHDFYSVKQELQVHGTCHEIFVGFLAREDIDRYLSLVYPDHAFPPDFADLVYARTEGSPLFMADLLRYLQARGVIAKAGNKWSLAQTMPDLRQELPESVRSMIQRKLERLDPEDRRLLTVASVQGHEFDSAVIAGTLQRDAAEIEEALQRLDQIHGLVRLVRESEFPDRTLTLRYAFVHILYQQALYSDLQPTRRAALSVALAQTLERHHGERSVAAAAELACLYEVGRDFSRAAKQMSLAAQNAAQVFAHREAISLAERGLGLLNTISDPQERAALELPLVTMLGMQLQVTLGFAAPEAHAAYRRARELCWQVRNPNLRFPVLWGLWLHSKVRSELVKAQEMAEELAVLARQLCDPSLALQSHQALGMTAFCQGRPADAVGHVEQASTLYDSQRHRTHAYLFGQDPCVMCKSFGAIALWQMGFADQALRTSDEAIRLSRDLSPSSQAIALHFAAMLHQLCRNSDRVLECTTASTTIATEHGFSFWLAGGTILKGWALAVGGSPDEGLRQIQSGLRDWDATGSVTYKTYYLGLLAEALGTQHRYDEARGILDEGLALAQATGEGLCEPELHRLRGELLLKSSPTADRTAVTDSFDQAIAIARQQQSVAFELRSAISANRHLQHSGRDHNSRETLRQVCDKLTEGFQTTDFQEARELLGS